MTSNRDISPELHVLALSEMWAKKWSQGWTFPAAISLVHKGQWKWLTSFSLISTFSIQFQHLKELWQKSMKPVEGKQRARRWPNDLKAGEKFENVLIRSASVCPPAWPCQINSVCALVCLRGFISGLDSFPLQALHHQTEGVATRWLNKHITQLPITQIHLAPSCQRASHSSTASPQRQCEESDSCVCVFNFTHRRHPSSAALPPRCPETMQSFKHLERGACRGSPGRASKWDVSPGLYWEFSGRSPGPGPRG